MLPEFSRSSTKRMQQAKPHCKEYSFEICFMCTLHQFSIVLPLYTPLNSSQTLFITPVNHQFNQ